MLIHVKEAIQKRLPAIVTYFLAWPAATSLALLATWPTRVSYCAIPKPNIFRSMS